MRLRMVRALAKRDLRNYFTNPTGYVFLTLFIFLSAAAAFWQPRFFLDNLATLDQLNAVFPNLLVFFVPALTMSVWADERRHGTDELLLTLPATDLEIVLGKYGATLGVYTAALGLSLSHVLVLAWLGSPDPGLLAANFLGYWLAGAALLAVGMLASMLTAHVTVAFVLGALFCAGFAFIDSVAALHSEALAEKIAPLGVAHHFDNLARGVVALSSVVYFVAVAGFFLYLNVLLLGRRHWPPQRVSRLSMGQHHVIRALSLVAILVGLATIVARSGVRADATAERLHSLSGETRRLLGELSADRPVFIQAFISREVPTSYVQARENVLNLLREIDNVAGPKVEVRIEETEPFTEAAREAREKFGINPRPVPQEGGAVGGSADVFFGLAFTCGPEEQVIPFFDRGLPAEYEIARSLRVVARAAREKIGIVETEMRLFGGLDFQTMHSNPPWSIVEELKKQYDVVSLNPKSPITADVDGVLVVMPSSLGQPAMDNLDAYIRAGHPALLLDDPLPLVNLGLAASEQAGAGMNPFMRQGQPPPTPKGDIQKLLAGYGLGWDPARVVWDAYNPHPDLRQIPPEVVFVGPGNGNTEAVSAASPASSGLQEVVFLYAGAVTKGAGDFDFRPLLRTGQTSSGSFAYPQLVQRSFFGTQLNRSLPHRPDGKDYTLAAQSRSNATGAGAKPTNVILVADADFVSEQFFDLRKQGAAGLNFDNVTFILNAIDVLVGDESFVALRKRRPRHRTLERVEAQTRAFTTKRAEDEKQAEGDAEKALAEAQKHLTEKVREVESRSDLDAQAKEIMARNLQEVENRRLQVLKANIEAEKNAKIQRSRESTESQVRAIESSLRGFAVLLPPIPVFVMGVVVFVRRARREREGALAARRLRS
jgi:ABC-2 type transport system permease protein